MTRTVGIYLYHDMEVLDFAGPFEVFTTAARLRRRERPDNPAPFEVVTLGDREHGVAARGGLVVNPSHTFATNTKIHVLIIPGGIVTAELEREQVVEWIARTAGQCEIVASVCTGAFLLAKAGLLHNQRATTHWEDIGDLQAMFPDLEVVSGARWVDNGAVVTSAGISAGIDMSLHLVARLEGEELAVSTARQMEFDWQHQSVGGASRRNAHSGLGSAP
jgi:transcriptional regulator GlxA family with amidase domain